MQCKQKLISGISVNGTPNNAGYNAKLELPVLALAMDD